MSNFQSSANGINKEKDISQSSTNSTTNPNSNSFANSTISSTTNSAKVLANVLANVLVITACPVLEGDKRAGLILDLAKTYIEGAKKQGLTVDVLNLYDEEDFDPVFRKLNDREGKILEYRIRVDRASVIAVFHPSYFEGPPAVLKGFLDRVFVPGYAFRTEKNESNFRSTSFNGMFKNKWLKVFATGEKSEVQTKFLEGDVLSNFWHRSFGGTCGFKVEYTYFGQIRSAGEQKIQAWHQKITRSTNFLENIKDIAGTE